MMRVAQGTTLVVGLGLSGRAICRHLARLGVPFMVADTRAMPPGLDDFRQAHPGVAVHTGPLSQLDMSAAEEVVLSPGISPATPGLEGLAEQVNPRTGEPRLVGEIALFCRAVKGRLAAITGSNAKSTVTTLVGDMAREAGVAVAVGGNLGTPALDLLAEQPEAELYVLELSSFQLETTPRLDADCAAFLNLSEDHLDRHGDMAGYRAAKQRIFHGARQAIVNADDPATWPAERKVAPTSVQRFGLEPLGVDGWGLVTRDNTVWLARGETPWLAADELALSGRHHLQNALAALALGSALGLEREAMCRALRRFRGLAHRSEPVACINDVRWINDSKGTNVGATLAAVNGLGPSLAGRLILLAGGVGKGADFAPLAKPLAAWARGVVLFGQDADAMARALEHSVPVRRVDTLEQAVEEAARLAEPGDAVLLSPACASLDQFRDYQARGEAFCERVQALAGTPNIDEAGP